MIASRLGLLPWVRRRLRPAELIELWEGWRWRYARAMDIAAINAAWVSNHIPFNSHSSQPDDVAQALRGYLDVNGEEPAED